MPNISTGSYKTYSAFTTYPGPSKIYEGKGVHDLNYNSFTLNSHVTPEMTWICFQLNLEANAYKIIFMETFKIKKRLVRQVPIWKKKCKVDDEQKKRAE